VFVIFLHYYGRTEENGNLTLNSLSLVGIWTGYLPNKSEKQLQYWNPFCSNVQNFADNQQLLLTTVVPVAWFVNDLPLLFPFTIRGREMKIGLRARSREDAILEFYAFILQFIILNFLNYFEYVLLVSENFRVLLQYFRIFHYFRPQIIQILLTYLNVLNFRF